MIPAASASGVTGIVLGGGHGRRLGRSKPLMTLGGKLLLARVADALRPLVDELVLVVRPDQSDATPDTGIALRMHVVTDTAPHQGPLAAIDAGLAAAVTPAAFLVGADYPFISRSLVRMMIEVAFSQGPEPESAIIRAAGSLQPLHSVLAVGPWRQVVSDALERQEQSFRRLVESAAEAGEPPVNVITEDDVERHDPQGLSLLDIDTPEDLGVARRVLDRRRVTLRPDIRRGGV